MSSSIKPKRISQVLVFLIVISSVLTGCIGSENPPSDIEIPQSDQVEFNSATIGIIQHNLAGQMENNNSILELVEHLGFNLSVVWLEAESALLVALRF